MTQLLTKFFPRDAHFWIAHFSVWLVILGASIFNAYLKLGTIAILPNFLVSLMIIFVNTFTCLIYRCSYKICSWHELDIKAVSWRSFIIMTTGAAICALVLVVHIKYVAVYLHDPDFLEKADLPASQTTLIQNFIGNFIVMGFFLNSWAAIYILITEFRRRQFEKLQNIRLKSDLREAQLNALVGQINPHFLFNGLNNIRSLIRQDTEKAIEMVTALAEVLRFSLKSHKHDKINLRQEIEIVENFISLASLQFDERLKFTMHVDTLAYQAFIPPMCIQILVENALKHGIDNIKNGGELQLNIHTNNTRLHIEVSNTGSLKKTNNPNSTGTGLINVMNRLKLIYNESASFSLIEESGLVIARIELPLETSP